MSAVDLGTAPLSRLFWRYVTPTVAAMLVTGIYVTIDGIFVGHILGQDGLAGMMLAYPICAVLYAVGALIGMGSSALASFYLGKGKQARARHIVGNALVMVLIASALLAFIGIHYGDEMLVWMGAEGGHLRRRIRLSAVVRLARGVRGALHGLYRPAAQRWATRPHHLDPGGGRRAQRAARLPADGGDPLGAGGGRHCHHAFPGGDRGGCACGTSSPRAASCAFAGIPCGPTGG